MKLITIAFLTVTAAFAQTSEPRMPITAMADEVIAWGGGLKTLREKQV